MIFWQEVFDNNNPVRIDIHVVESRKFFFRFMMQSSMFGEAIPKLNGVKNWTRLQPKAIKQFFHLVGKRSEALNEKN